MLRPTARRCVATAAALLAAAGAGCGGESEQASGDTRPLVTFGRTGGNENKVYGLVVERGGHATLTQYPERLKKFEVSKGKRDDLGNALDELNIEDLQPSYVPDSPTAEGHRYSVTFQGTTVQAAEKAELPDQLRSVINLLDDLVDDET